MVVLQNINIGTEKSCFFVPISLLLVTKLRLYPLLYFAVEEALECEKNDYYASGIMVFAQLLNIINKATPDSRHDVAHKILEKRPTKEILEKMKMDFREAARVVCEKEIERINSIDLYKVKVNNEWWKLNQELRQ